MSQRLRLLLCFLLLLSAPGVGRDSGDDERSEVVEESDDESHDGEEGESGGVRTVEDQVEGCETVQLVEF